MSAIVTGSLVAALLELFFYGSYFVLLTTVIYLFRRRHGIPPKSAPAALLLLALVVQFLVITVVRAAFSIKGGDHDQRFSSSTRSTQHTKQFSRFVLAAEQRLKRSTYLNLTRPSFVANMTLMVITHHLTDAFVVRISDVTSSFELIIDSDGSFTDSM
jgi:hypothetical protein